MNGNAFPPTQAGNYRPIRAMTADERRAYNRLVKQRSRAKAAQRTKSGSLPTTKEAALALLAVAGARVALDDAAIAQRLAQSVANLVGSPCDETFQATLGNLLRRVASPRRMETSEGAQAV